jgi:hypothetical protein
MGNELVSREYKGGYKQTSHILSIFCSGSIINKSLDKMSFIMASHLSPDQRRRIRTLRYDAGLSYGRIVQITGATKRAVQSISMTPTTPRKALGRLRIITAPFCCELQAIIENDTHARHMTYDELSTKLQLSASTRTMRWMMQDLAYIRAIARAKPFLNDTAKAKRLAWAINHKPYGTQDWARVI